MKTRLAGLGNRLRIALVVLGASVPLTIAALVAGGASAPTSHAGGTNGAMAVDCDVATAGVQSQCAYDPDTPFMVQIRVLEEPTPNGYYGFQAKVRWTDGVVNYLPTENAADEALWPDCNIPGRHINVPEGDPSVLFGCTPLPLQASTFIGPVLQFAFQCKPEPAQTDLTLVPIAGDTQLGTHFIDQNLSPIVSALTGATISCGEGGPGGGTDGEMVIDCNTSMAGIQAECSYSTMTAFDIAVHVVEPPASGYFGFQAKVRWPASGLTYQPRANPADEALWPDCNVPARTINLPGDSSVAFGCVPFPLPVQGSLFTGPVLRFAMRCTEPIQPDGSEPNIVLVPRQGDTQLGSHFLNANLAPVDPTLLGAMVTCLPDADGDGCTDQQELGPNPLLGGGRNPNNFWDFFDTPDVSNVRDRAITSADIARVVQRFGSSDIGAGAFDRQTDPHSAPNPPVSPTGARSNYHPAFDRSPAPGKFSGPADGIIATGDIALMVRQFGHSCATPPS